MTNPEHWGVIGGGMLGMTLALRLREAGHEVTLFEGAPALGGLASVWQIGDTPWDKHYHVILMSDSHLRGLLDELGLTADLQWVETKTGCYTAGTLYSVSNTVEFLRFPPLRLVDKLRLGWTIFYASRIRNWEWLETQTAEAWLVRHSGRRTYEQFWLPLLRSKLGGNHRFASASFIWAIIQRLYAARRSGLKKEMFGYVEGGYRVILDRFAAHLNRAGVRTELGVRVQSISSQNGSVIVRTNDESISFDRVIVTQASPLAARLIEGLSDEEVERMQGVTYQGIICASALTSQPLSGYYVTNITDDWVPFTGVIEMSALVGRERFGGSALIYLPRYTEANDSAMEWSDEEVEERFLSALERMYPHFDRSNVQAFQTSRVRYVLPVSTLGYSKRVPPFETSVPGVFTVNSSQVVNGTLNVNETVQLAERAMAHLLSQVDDETSATDAQAGVT